MIITTEDLIKFLKKYPGFSVRIFSMPENYDFAIDEKFDIDVDIKEQKIIFDGQYKRTPKYEI